MAKKKVTKKEASVKSIKLRQAERKKEALFDELINAVVVREYQIVNPQLLNQASQEIVLQAAIFYYQNDAMFKNRVDALTNGVMAIVDKHVTF